MATHVYYKSWPHKALKQIAVDCTDVDEAIDAVTHMLKQDKEKHILPILAVIVGGKK